MNMKARRRSGWRRDQFQRNNKASGILKFEHTFESVNKHFRLGSII